MGRSIAVVALALVGLLCAAGMGYAAYVVSRGSVAVPVTRLQRTPGNLTPSRVRERVAPKPKTRTGTTTTVAPPPPPPPPTTTDDHGGRGRGGSGGGGHGGDD
ncbi:MAG TPA: hypothetical protein VFK62_06170 [Gaiellaceae bacterium]|nr:hypothetical protein [Gaiellaceae bacterium]